MDLLLFLNVLPFSNRLAIVNYDQLFFGDYTHELEHVFKALNISSIDYPFDDFEFQFFRQKSDYIKKSANSHYDAFARHIKLNEFENNFFNLEISARFNLLADYSEFIKANSARFLNDFIDSINAQEVEELYWATSLICKNMTDNDCDLYFPDVDSKFKLFLDSHTDQSINALLQIVEIYPRLGPALLELSKRYFRINKLDLAIAYACRAIETLEKSPHHYNYYGNLLMRMGQWQAAEKAFYTALEIEANFHPAYVQLNQLYLQKKEFDKALAAINKAIKLDKTNPKYYLHRGNTHVRCGEVDNAFDAYTKALKLDPEFPAAYVQLSHLYTQKQEFDNAIEAITNAIELDDTIANYHLHQGNLLVRMGYKDHANRAYQKATQLDPTIKTPIIK